MKHVYISVMFALLTSCNATPSSTVNKQEEQQQTNPPVFKMINIPSILTSGEERAEYLVLNYWNNLNFADTTYINQEEVTEQAFVNYIDLFPHTSIEVVSKSVKNLMTKASVEKKMLTYFFELFDKYLYDPNSPMRNEEFFIPALEGIIASPAYDETEKIRPQSLLQLALKNRVGDSANDFSFTLKNGQKQKLYEQKAEYLLLYFYNPGCPACKEASGKLKASNTVGSLLKNNKLKILAIYPDEDLSEWNSHLEDIPTSWTNGYDQEVYIKNEEAYDLKAIPTIYLLDKNKKVIFKDAYVEQVEAFLSNVK